MSIKNLIDYHTNRATREMDLGLTTDRMAASRAHLGLAALHFERVRQLATATGEKVAPALRM
jgi:hypothetical protein